MNDEHPLYSKIRKYVANEFGGDFDASIAALQTIEAPSRFKGPVFLAVVSLKPLEEDVVATISKADPVDVEQLRKSLAEGDEVACIFNSSGEEIERHFRGMDYFFEYQKIEI